MSKKKKKNTRKQKIVQGKPIGQSKYALKVAKRAKLAKKLELPVNTPTPVINEILKYGQGD